MASPRCPPCSTRLGFHGQEKRYGSQRMAAWVEKNQCGWTRSALWHRCGSVKERRLGWMNAEEALAPRLPCDAQDIASPLVRGCLREGLPSGVTRAGPFTARCFSDTRLCGELLPLGPSF